MLSQTGSPVHLRSSAALVSRNSDSSHNSRAGHPGWLRCSSLTYSRYARSSRLAIRAPRSGTYATNHCYGTLGVLNPASTVCYLRWSRAAKRPSRRGVNCGFDRALLLIAHDADGDLVFVRVAQAAEKVVARPDRPAIDRRDD